MKISNRAARDETRGSRRAGSGKRGAGLGDSVRGPTILDAPAAIVPSWETIRVHTQVQHLVRFLTAKATPSGCTLWARAGMRRTWPG